MSEDPDEQPPRPTPPTPPAPPAPEPEPAARERHRAIRWTAVAMLTVVMVTAYFFFPLDSFGPHRPVASWITLTAALTLVTALLLRQIRNAVLDRPGTLPGLVIVLLMSLSILVFASAYYTLAKDPGAFDGLHTRLDALYFTVVTVGTVGYGDITPHSQTARAVTLLQIIYSFVFLTAAATALTSRLRNQLLRHPPPETRSRHPSPGSGHPPGS